jgi:hypothetical protein
MPMPDWEPFAAIAAFLAMMAAPFIYLRWRLNRDVARIMRRLRDSASPPPPPSWPAFVVRIDDIEIACTRPDGTRERIAWADLDRVTILTTADGPFAPDAFWVLTGAAGGCLSPWGAKGDRELLERLQHLPGFDDAAVLRAVGSTQPARFECWRRAD